MSRNSSFSLSTQTATTRKITYRKAVELQCVFTLGVLNCPVIFGALIFTAIPVSSG
jgi:hypothetical protein